MRLTINVEHTIDEILEMFGDFLKKNYSEYSVVKNANFYLTLKDPDGNNCPENNKEILLSSDGPQRDLSDKTLLTTAKLIDHALDVATSKDTFIQELEKHGYQVRFSNNAKHITFTTPNGKKIRNWRLKNLTKNDCSTTAIRERLHMELIDIDDETPINFFGTVNGLHQFCSKHNLLEKNHYVIYVLALEDGKYYVGQTCNFPRRMKEHFLAKKTTAITKIYKPVAIHEIIDITSISKEASTVYETAKTIACMNQLGISNVRGGDFIYADNDETKRLLKTHGYLTKQDRCFPFNNKADKYLNALKDLETLPVLYRN